MNVEHLTPQQMRVHKLLNRITNTSPASAPKQEHSALYAAALRRENADEAGPYIIVSTYKQQEALSFLTNRKKKIPHTQWLINNWTETKRHWEGVRRHFGESHLAMSTSM